MIKTYRNILISVVCFIFLTFSSLASAELIGGPDIIAAPEYVIDNAPGAENTSQQAFNEAQGVELLENILVDDGLLVPVGTIVDSHMIFLNTPPGTPVTSSENVSWTFDGVIVGVMSDVGGTLEAGSNAILGAPGTEYPGAFRGRGQEENDKNFFDDYVVVGNQIIVTMHVTEPGDWIRVVTDPTQKKVTVCHVPPGNPDNPREISVAIKSLSGHINRHAGDVVGSCN